MFIFAFVAEAQKTGISNEMVCVLRVWPGP